MPYPATVIHVSIRRSAADVYAYAADPRHLPEWAAGLSRSAVHEEGGYWVAESPMGRVKIKFAPQNSFGVLDHDVTLPDGSTFHNPFRVQANGDGAEVIFTLYRLPGVSDADYKRDADRIRADLATLKGILDPPSR